MRISTAKPLPQSKVITDVQLQQSVPLGIELVSGKNSHEGEGVPIGNTF